MGQPPAWNTSPAPVSTTFTTTSTTPSATENWNVAPFVQAAATASAPDWTLVLSNSSETSSNYWVAFSAAPTISITYDFPPLTPSASSMLITPRAFAPSGSQFTSSAKPTFSATAVSPVGANVSYQYQILSGSTVVASGTSASVTSGTPGPWTDTTALTDDSTYTFQVRAYDGTAYGPWSAAQSFTVETDTPGPVTVSCSGYPAKTWSAQQAGASTCSWAAPLPYMDGDQWSLGGTWSWSATNSISIDPGPGEYNLEVIAVSDAGQWGTPVHYTFAVGASGAMLSPVTGSQTSTSVVLWAGVPAGYTGAEYYYRVGTTGAFQPILASQVTDLTCNCAASWLAATTPDSDGWRPTR